MPVSQDDFIFYAGFIGCFIAILLLPRISGTEKKSRTEIPNEVKNIIFQGKRK